MERVWVTTQLGTAGASRPANGGPKIDVVKGTEQIDDVHLHATRWWATSSIVDPFIHGKLFQRL